MDTKRARMEIKTYRARLRGGPDDGTDIAVAAMPDGEPPEFLYADPEESGMYLLAGLPNPDASTPYWWVASGPSLVRTTDPVDATWTLISLADDGATKLWHQHGEGTEPVQLTMEPVGRREAPTHVGRAYNCSVCHDTAVLSRPIQVHGAEDARTLDPSRRAH